MRTLVRTLDTGSQAVSFMLGGLVVVLAVAVMATSLDISDIAAWANRIFGVTFIGLLSGLVLTALFCWVKLLRYPGDPLWLQAGMQSANGVSTLALTYTLLGISLGIGSLAEQQLTPETVQVVIRGLTEKFSLAFMTTVVGLPLSAVLRTMLMVTNAKSKQQVVIPPAPRGVAFEEEKS